MSTQLRTTTTPIEALIVVAICFGWAIAFSTWSVAENFQHGEFNDAALHRIVITEFICTGIALTFLRARGYAVSALYPAPSGIGAAIAVLLYVASVWASWIATLPFAAAHQPIDDMMATASPSLTAIITMALVNGAFEEVFLLGFLLRGLRAHGLSIALGVSLLVRVLYHLYQGPLGAISVLGFGLVLSLYFVRSGSLFPPVLAHVVADIVPFL